MTDATLLAVDGLTVEFLGEDGWVTAVEQVSLDVRAGECLGIVGESGSGKSVMALTVLGLHRRASTRIPCGSIRFDGRDLLGLSRRQMRAVRGREIAMIFQDPMSSLNPVLTVADQVCEALTLHRGLSARAARHEAARLFDLVRIPDAARRLDDYPHRMSGGMCQRVMIAVAIAGQPRLLIADEPTTALDVTVQAQVLELLRDLQDELEMAVLLISHDLGVVAQFADRVMVMYAGRTVETAPTAGLFGSPIHPYTKGLLAAAPRLDSDTARMNAIPGSIPDASASIPGCRFHPRCTLREEACLSVAPPMLPAELGHLARCPPGIRRRVAT